MGEEKDKVEGPTSDRKETTPTQADNNKATTEENEAEDFPDPDEDDLDDLDGKHLYNWLSMEWIY